MVAAWVLLAVSQPPPSAANAPPMAPLPTAPAKPIEWPAKIADKPISHYIGELTNPDPTSRWEAVRTLPYFGPTAARQATKPLIGMLDDPDPGVRVNAILTLVAVGLESKADVPKAVAGLRACINNTVPGSAVRMYAARALGELGTDAYEALEALTKLVKDPSWENRDAAAAALGRVGSPVYEPSKGDQQGAVKRPASVSARIQLVTLLADVSKPVRQEAVMSLLMLGAPNYVSDEQYMRDAKPLIDKVMARLAPATDKVPGEKDAGVRLWLHLLAISYDDRHTPVAAEALKAGATASDPGVRAQALTVLAFSGPLASIALEEVRAALKASEPGVVRAAIGCLSRMGPEAKKAVADLQLLAATSKEPGMKELAELMLKQLAAAAVPPPPGK